MSRRRGRAHHHERARHDRPDPGPNAPVEPRAVQAAEPTDVAPPSHGASTPVSPAAPAAQSVSAPRPADAPPNATPQHDPGHAPAAPSATAPVPATDAARATAGRTLGVDAPPFAPPPDATRPNPTNGAPSPVAATTATHPAPGPGPSAPGSSGPRMNGQERGSPCTAPQLRRFIKSRPYVPMHELRRRFAIDGADDDVNAIELQPGRIFVGLPAREGQLLGELLRAGEIGYELSLDPRTPIVIGVYPMRPVPRP
jgi:hypothetical protein